MKQLINGELFDLSEEEIAEVEAREAKSPLAEWEAVMSESDKDLPRWAEDLFDLVTGAKQLVDLPELAAKIADKKILRGSKP